MRPVTRMIPFILAPEGSRGVKAGRIVNDLAAALSNRAAACFARWKHPYLLNDFICDFVLMFKNMCDETRKLYDPTGIVSNWPVSL